MQLRLTLNHADFSRLRAGSFEDDDSAPFRGMFGDKIADRVIADTAEGGRTLVVFDPLHTGPAVLDEIPEKSSIAVGEGGDVFCFALYPVPETRVSGTL